MLYSTGRSPYLKGRGFPLKASEHEPLGQELIRMGLATTEKEPIEEVKVIEPAVIVEQPIKVRQERKPQTKTKPEKKQSAKKKIKNR